MDSFLENVGILAIAFLIIYIYKKILEWHDYRHSGFYADEKVYKAADEFVHGASSDDVKTLLADCFDFDEGDAKKIMSLSTPHRTDKDGGYKAFIRSVNKVLGDEVYDEKRHVHGTE
ncbi:hypothetical protein SDC9_106171 [bioreactor metagenome]|uniref:Uncharacterized protein n=1 Tax=bioreactor metagenome TaxID=1076179 RepID=A0A645B431_9ZZZZ|nr:hypothetical protein [Dehalobacterium formicoaceticum]